jgi:CDP-diacylglycerol--glycerol-3-phosphate 3-phosphatidyltransferase
VSGGRARDTHGTNRRAGSPVAGSFVSPEFRNRVRAVAVPIALGLGHLGLTPNALTIVGFLGTCAAAVAAAAQAWTLAGVLVLVFGIFDLFDGALARATGTTSAFGAFLDSTLDRLGENLVLAGVVVGAAQAGFVLGAGLAALAMASASVVTYTRARAEAVGLHGEVGIAPRPERLVVLSVGLVLTGVWGGLQTYSYLGCCFTHSPIYLNEADGSAWLAGSLALIVGTCAITIVQRIVHVHRQSTHQ